MKKLQFTTKYRKTIVSVCVLAVIMVMSVAGNCMAQTFDSIRMFPKHIGIFTSVGTQQFVAYGIKAGQSPVNITKNVSWISSDNNKVTIDENGLATVVDGVTSGQVKVTCSYPKTGGGANASGTSTNLLLLSN